MYPVISYIFSAFLACAVAIACSATTLFICMSYILLEKVARKKKSITITSYAEFLRDTFLTKQNRSGERIEKHKLRKLEATQSYEVLEEEKEVTPVQRKTCLVRVPSELYDQRSLPSRHNPRQPRKINEDHPQVDKVIYEEQHRRKGGLAPGIVGQQRSKVLRDHEYKADESKEQDIRMEYKRSEMDLPNYESVRNLKKFVGQRSLRQVSPHHRPGDSVVFLERLETENSDLFESCRVISKPV